MDLPTALSTVFWLARDTFRQALASGVFWVMLVFNIVCIVLCLSVSVVGPAPPNLAGGDKSERLNPFGMTAEQKQAALETGFDLPVTELRIGFGALQIQMSGWYAPEVVGLVQFVLAAGVAGVTGIVLALIWTAGFLPEFLQPSAASVLLAKPVPRWSLLLGKYLGVLVFVALQAVVFVGGTWLALGITTGYLLPAYLVCIPLLILNFAVIYSFSVLLAVSTRNTVVCVFGSILFWLLCWGMNYARVVMLAHALHPEANPELRPPSALSVRAVEVSYWIIPKPLDLAMMVERAVQPRPQPYSVPAFERTKEHFYPEWSVLSSMLFAAVLLAVAARQFTKTNY